MLTLAELAADRHRYFLIDLRDPAEYADAHVEGAVHIPPIELANRAAEITAIKNPVTICGEGVGRSTEAAELLCRLGYRDAHWLEGDTNGGLQSQT